LLAAAFELVKRFYCGLDMLNQSWEAKINRADELATAYPSTRELLVFYSGLLRAQKRIHEALEQQSRARLSGTLLEDLPALDPLFDDLLRAIESVGTPVLGEAACSLRHSTDGERRAYLLDQWHAPSPDDFFAKAFLQPYARWSVESGLRPMNRKLQGAENRCPFCAGRPQVSYLSIKESSSDGGGRDLVCSTCLTSWPFRRVLCAGCGEERPAKLAYYQAAEYTHVRVEACESCGCYLKGVDMTRFGFAVPLVDEVAAAPLDLWAQERGYQKIELNLVGL
jgi:FdhE protein